MNNKEIQSNDKKNLQNNNQEENKKNINDILVLKNNKINELKLQLLNNEKKINDIELRKLAKIENLKKNTIEEIKNIKNTETEKFFKKIMPILNSLEDILILSNKLNIKDTPLIKGIELTLQSLFNILFKSGVNIDDQNNKIFDPKIHTPIFIESSEKILPNHIISIQKPRLIFNNILLRKAVVTIPKN